MRLFVGIHQMKRRGFTFIKNVGGNYEWENIQKQWTPWKTATKFMESIK